MKAQTTLCVVLFVGFLAAVGEQTVFHQVPEPHLHGVFKPIEQPLLGVESLWDGVKSFWDGRFQKRVQGTEQKEGWMDRNVGFRSVWIKTDNQINFSLFREVSTRTNPQQQIILGKDNWLYEGVYVDNFLGLDCAPDEFLQKFSSDVKDFQEELQQQDITFLLVISTSKSAHYAEHLPDWVWRERSEILQRRPGSKSNYDRLMALLQQKGVNCVDSVELFRRQKKAHPEYHLFARGGTHWTHYGAGLVVGEMLKRLKELTGKDLMQLSCKSVTVDCHTIGTDNDLGAVLNIWTPWVTEGPTPLAHTEGTGGTWKPDVLWVGDSFSDALTNLMDVFRVYRRRDTLFLLLEKRMYPEGITVPIDRENYDWAQQEIPGRDIVIFEVNEASLGEAGY